MKRLKDQSGQMIVEMIMIIALLFGLTLFVSNQFSAQGFIRQIVSGPWANLAGMIQNGVWAPPNVGAPQHPANLERHISLRGEEANN